VDVTLRISGFFRDAFPHLIEMFDQAVSLVVELDEPLDQNFPAQTLPRRPRSSQGYSRA
jgi:cobaltochelatase CobN